MRTIMNETLRRELIERVEKDRTVRAELAATGELHDGYAPRMRAVHRDNAVYISNVLESHGWPGTSLVGEDGEEAAWLLLQHAIDYPDLLRRGRELLRAAVGRGEAPAWQFAYLDDRIRVFEGRKQRYGSQFDTDESGQLNPCPLEDPENIDSLRAEVGLGPMAEQIGRMRADALKEGDRQPRDHARKKAEAEAWLRSTGWRSD
jgi:hypothetical protein